uniref:Uncharacterized protein n=1 Tax=Anguilla anguilla TaxID=7936 RepID=A0A0E9S4L2_ANGAN
MSDKEILLSLPTKKKTQLVSFSSFEGQCSVIFHC